MGRKQKWFAVLFAAALLIGVLSPQNTLTAWADGITGLVQENDGSWSYYVNGAVDTTFTGLVQNAGETWYVEKGKLNLGFTDLFCAADGWYFVMDGRVPTEYTGLVRNGEGLWYVENGMINWEHTGLVSSAEGWYYVLNGRVTEEYTGLVRNEAGMWYVAEGILDWNHTELVSSEEGWFYVMNGRVTEEYTGLVRNEAGMWYIDSGKLNWEYCGLVSSAEGWFYVLDGRVPEEYVGLVANEEGNWYVQNGTISFNYEGLVGDATGWWYVQGSQVNTNYTGLATNENGTWYVQNGGIDFGYTGTVTIDGKEYTVSGGAVLDVPKVTPQGFYKVTSPDGIVFGIEFDDNGKMVSQVRYDANGKIVAKGLVGYYSDGRLGRIQWIVHTEQEEGELIGSVDYEYYDSGALDWRTLSTGFGCGETLYAVEVNKIRADGSLDCNFYQLEPYRSIDYAYNEDGTLTNYNVAEYNKNGVQMKLTVYDGKTGEIAECQIRELDSEGRTARINLYDGNGVLLKYLVYEYSENGDHAEHYFLADGSPDYSYGFYADGRYKFFIAYLYDEVTGEYTGWYHRDFIWNEEGTIGIAESEVWYDTNDEVLEYVYRTINEKEMPLVTEVRNPDGTIRNWTEHVYFEDGVTEYKFYQYIGENLLQAYRENDENEVPVYSEWYIYDEAGKLESKDVYEYENGECVKNTQYDGEGNVDRWWTVLEFHEDGSIKKSAYYDGPGTEKITALYENDGLGIYSWDTRYSYDENGQLEVYLAYESKYNQIVKCGRYDGTGTLIALEVFAYYEDGSLRQTVTYLDEEATILSGLEVYDETGELLREENYSYNEYGNLSNGDVTIYENGKEIESILYFRGKLLYHTYSEYYDNGSVASIKKYRHGNPEDPVLIILYNENGGVTYREEAIYSSDDTVLMARHIKNQYDADGNPCYEESQFYREGQIYQKVVKEWTVYEIDGTETEYCYAEGEVEYYYIRTYKDGVLANEIKYDGSGAETLVKKQIFDEWGVLTEEQYYTQEGVLVRIDYYEKNAVIKYAVVTFNEDNTKVHYDTYNTEDVLLFYTDGILDANGDMVSFVTYYPNNSPYISFSYETWNYTKYSYDNAGLLETYIVGHYNQYNRAVDTEDLYSKDGEHLKRTEYVYIGGGCSWIQVKEYYDFDNLVLKTDTYYTPDWQVTGVNKWSEDGWLTEYVNYDETGRIMEARKYRSERVVEESIDAEYTVDGVYAGYIQHIYAENNVDYTEKRYNAEGELYQWMSLEFYYTEGSSSMFFKKITIYSVTGAVERIEDYDSFGLLAKVTEYQYEEDSCIGYVISYYDWSDVPYKTETYDAAGNLVSTETNTAA